MDGATGKSKGFGFVQVSKFFLSCLFYNMHSLCLLQVDHINLMMDSESGRSKGYRFVTVSSNGASLVTVTVVTESV